MGHDHGDGMSQHQAFELRKEYTDEGHGFGGGSVALAGGESFNVGDAIQGLDEPIVVKVDKQPVERAAASPDGVIITSDPLVIEALNSYPALKPCALPEGWQPPAGPEAVNLDKLSKVEFADYVSRESNGEILLDPNKTRAEMDADYEAALAAQED
jgi:hypothetical protein